VQKKQLRNIGIVHVNLKGNENCSFKDALTWEKPVTYMTKGVYDPKYNKGFTEVELNELKAKWVEPTGPQRKLSANEQWYESWARNDWKQLERAFYARDNTEPTWDDEGNPITPRATDFEVVRKYFHQHTFQECYYIWDANAVTRYKMYVLTYCMRNMISIPKGSDWMKWL
jgi:hypothetical protein